MSAAASTARGANICLLRLVHRLDLDVEPLGGEPGDVDGRPSGEAPPRPVPSAPSPAGVATCQSRRISRAIAVETPVGHDHPVLVGRQRADQRADGQRVEAAGEAGGRVAAGLAAGVGLDRPAHRDAVPVQHLDLGHEGGVGQAGGHLGDEEVLAAAVGREVDVPLDQERQEGGAGPGTARAAGSWCAGRAPRRRSRPSSRWNSTSEPAGRLVEHRQPVAEQPQPLHRVDGVHRRLSTRWT